MYSSQVFVKIFAASESLFCVSLAMQHRTVKLFLRSAVHTVDLTFMPQKTARVCETQQLGTLWLITLVWPFMFVHMFTVRDRLAHVVGCLLGTEADWSVPGYCCLGLISKHGCTIVLTP